MTILLFSQTGSTTDWENSYAIIYFVRWTEYIQIYCYHVAHDNLQVIVCTRVLCTETYRHAFTYRIIVFYSALYFRSRTREIATKIRHSAQSHNEQWANSWYMMWWALPFTFLVFNFVLYYRIRCERSPIPISYGVNIKWIKQRYGATQKLKKN